jgi:hypothetical protein
MYTNNAEHPPLCNYTPMEEKSKVITEAVQGNTYEYASNLSFKQCMQEKKFKEIWLVYIRATITTSTLTKCVYRKIILPDLAKFNQKIPILVCT